ncbi:GNAT family N-acetyltransferase [uncultured Jannaschia sp.]|uniref:GNAT family N-acetyltransferase n=1 Tax=uncultured Jannaschia sp. TaxID=293347 RepID=UPI00260E9ED6|nr:GNAT family N-acetyltransferase [uncultured Jannaschia sp.]
MSVTVRPARDLDRAAAVLRTLRHSLPQEVFDRRLAAARDDGYVVLEAHDGDLILGVLGYRIVVDVCWGRTLFVDDLVVAQIARGQGIGGALLGEAKARAQALRCDHLRLCSGLDRRDAHRFYEAHGLSRSSFQFVLALSKV